jgi:probable rRNA maturation factor
VAARALAKAGAPSPASLSVILSDDRELEELNVRHMGHEGPTDVLSFPLLDPSAFPPHVGGRRQPAAASAKFALPPRQRVHLGDIVISVERAIAQAPDARCDELRQLLVHGVLHVCGWDHAKKTERDAMRALEREIMST